MVDGECNLPNDPLAFIKDCVRHRRILWTYHVNMRLRNRAIGRESILAGIDTYEIIESYPDDKYFPSYLIFVDAKEFPYHVLFATDEMGNNVRVVTAYRPEAAEWEDDLRTRKPRK